MIRVGGVRAAATGGWSLGAHSEIWLIGDHRLWFPQKADHRRKRFWAPIRRDKESFTFSTRRGASEAKNFMRGGHAYTSAADEVIKGALVRREMGSIDGFFVTKKDKPYLVWKEDSNATAGRRIACAALDEDLLKLNGKQKKLFALAGSSGKIPRRRRWDIIKRRLVLYVLFGQCLLRSLITRQAWRQLSTEYGKKISRCSGGK